MTCRDAPKNRLTLLLGLALAMALLPGTGEAQDRARDFASGVPRPRRIYVPASRPQDWPPGDWEPVPLTELESRLGTLSPRPAAFLERADYSATLVDGKIRGARLEWALRRPDSASRFLSLGALNLNIPELAWSDPQNGQGAIPAVWGTGPDGEQVVALDRTKGQLVGTWELSGRRLAGSTEFDLELVPAVISRLKLKVAAGLVVRASAGELEGPTPLEPGWSEWRLNLGSRSNCRLRVSSPAAPNSANPLVVTHSQASYIVRPDSIRINTDFALEVLEASLRELRLTVDPEIQVTSIEYGDDGLVDWQIVPGSQGREIVARFPDALTGDGHMLQVQGIAQGKRAAAWALPRIRLQNALAASGKVTLRLQPPFEAADIRTDGYRQLELTAGEGEGEVFVFHETRGAGQIVIVPAESKAELTSRAATLIEPDRNQWVALTDLEWGAAAGSALSANCLIAEGWEIVDVRPVAGEPAGGAPAWTVNDRPAGGRVLHVHFQNAVRPQKPQRIRISSRRPAPDPGRPVNGAVLPPVAPLDTAELDHVLVAAAAQELVPLCDLAGGIERIAPGEIPSDMARLDFLAARLSDRRVRAIAIRTHDPNATGMLRFDPTSTGNPAPSASDPGDVAGPQELHPSVDRLPAVLGVMVHVAGAEAGFDHFIATFQQVGLGAGEKPFRFQLPAPAELISVSLNGRRVAPLASGKDYLIDPVLPIPSPRGSRPAAPSLAIEYRVPATMHWGPNRRTLILPDPDWPVLGTHLNVFLPQSVRFSGPPHSDALRALSERSSWQRRLLGWFSRPEGEPLFNPLSKDAWSAYFPFGPDAALPRSTEQVWRGTAAALPAETTFILWRASDVAWMSLGSALFCLLAGVVARRALPGHAKMAAACLSLLFFAALVLPPLEAELAGSALTGLVLAAFIPRRLLFARRDADDPTSVPAGSTQSFVVPQIAFLAAFSALALAAQAQPPTENGDRRPAGFDLLVPVDQEGREPGKDALVYAPREVLARLQRQAQRDALPGYVIGRCNLAAKIGAQGRLDVAARFQVHVFGTEKATPVLFPVGKVNLAGADACLLDGQPQPAIPAPDGKGLIVEIPGVAAQLSDDRGEAGADPAAEGPAAAPAALPVSSHVVELHIVPHSVLGVAGRNELESARLMVPRSCQLQAALASTGPLTLARIAGQGSGRPAPETSSGAAAIRDLELRPGPVDELVFSWSAAEGASGPQQIEAQVGISCLAEVLPASVELRYHLSYRVVAGQLESVSWRVPAAFSLRNVQGPQLAGYRFDPSEDGSRRLRIEFAAPQEGEFSLTGSFVLPVPAGVKQFPLPLLDPLSAETGPARKLGLKFHQLALKQPFDLRLSVSPEAADQPLRPRAVEEFLKEWNVSGGRPQQAFDLERVFTVNLSVENASAPPAVRAESIGHFHPGRLDWTYTAEVEHPGAPLFIDRLRVDPRLRVRSAWVQEDGADRLLRWSQARDELVLFLNDRAARSQAVRIEATMPLGVSQELEIPRIRFAEAVPGAERVALYRDQHILVRLSNPEDFPLTGGAPASDPSGDTLVARLDVLSEQSTPRFSIGPVSAEVSSETAILVDAKKHWLTLTAAAKFRVSSGRVWQPVVDLPEEFGARARVRSIPEAPFERARSPEGHFRFSFHPEAPVTSEFVVMATADEELPADAGRPPEIRIPGLIPKLAWLLESPGALERIEVDPALQPAAIPDWVKPALPEQSPGWRAYVWPLDAPAEFRPATAASSTAAADIARIDLWPQADGAIRGWLGLSIPELPEVLELDWPAGANLSALSLGNRFRSPPDPESGVCSIPTAGAAIGEPIWICWTADRRDGPRVGPLSLQVPWPRNMAVRNCRINLHAPGGFRIEAVAALAAKEASGPDRLVPAVLWDLLSDDRFRSGDVAVDISPGSSEGPFGLPEGLRMIERRRLQLDLSVLATLGVALICWRAVPPVFDWLSRHDLASWLALALFWWLFLEPGWLGPALALGSIARFLFVRFSAPSPAQEAS